MVTLEQRARAAKVAMTVFVAVYAAYFSAFTCLRHEHFETYAYDLGTFDQGIWLAGHSTTHFVTVRGLELLGDHVRVVSFVLAPLYWLWDDVRALLVLQSVVIACGAWLLWRIASRELPGRPGLVLAIAGGYLVHPAVQNLNLDHAHPDAFASTLLLASVDFLRAGRIAPFAVASMLAMSCKEDVALVYVAMGLALLFDSRRRRLGAVLAAAAGAWFLVCLLVILPHFNGVGFFRFGTGGFFSGLGDHAGDAWWYASTLLRPESALYLLRVGLANLYLFLLAPLSALPALPALLANLLSDTAYTRSLALHYQTSVLPFLYVASIDALAWLSVLATAPASPLDGAGPARRCASAALLAIAPAALVAAAVAANLAWAEVSLSHPGALASLGERVRKEPAIANLGRLLARIPRDAVVSADYSLVPHLSHRRGIYMFPNPFVASLWGIRDQHPADPSTVEYVALRASADRLDGPRDLALVDKLVAAGRLELVAGDRDVGLYHRISLLSADVHGGCGDWTGDGRQTEVDVQRIAAAILKAGDCPPRVCDADGDGVLRQADALRFEKHLADPSVPLQCPP